MLLFAIAVLSVLIVLVAMSKPRRPKGAPFDWTYRRPWWRPRWVFPDDR